LLAARRAVTSGTGCGEGQASRWPEAAGALLVRKATHGKVRPLKGGATFLPTRTRANGRGRCRCSTKRRHARAPPRVAGRVL